MKNQAAVNLGKLRWKGIPKKEIAHQMSEKAKNGWVIRRKRALVDKDTKPVSAE